MGSWVARLALAVPVSLLAATAALGAERVSVMNPTSGATLAVYVERPTTAGLGRLPALVLVPGGRGAANSFLRPAPGGSEAAQLAALGFVVVAFDPDGRGASGAVEDDNGFVHQDGLAAVVRYVAALPDVDPARVGLVSYSYGVTMAMGALARYSDLPVLFYIDWEGPANRDDTGGCDADRLGHLQDRACDDEAFWSEREAATFALSIEVPYLRLQSRDDHVQPDNDHALLLIANATAAEYGGNGRSPWTRLNDLEPNQVFSEANPARWPAKDLDLQPRIGEFALDLLRRFAPSASG